MTRATDGSPHGRVALTVLIPTKNEARNIERCLASVAGWAEEVIVLDSQSADGTVELADQGGAAVVQFHYKGGWPKKRQWALDTLKLRNEWILLLDADEVVPEPLRKEIEQAVAAGVCNGYLLRLEMVFLGRQLRYGDTALRKLSLFRHGTGRFERRLMDQDRSMGDMEVHEHVVVGGKVGELRNAIRHENINSLSRYIEKHNEYSNWAARVLLYGETSDLPPSLWGTQAQRRRFLRSLLWRVPGTPLFFFLYRYVFRLGFLDGMPGFMYHCFSGIQLFHTKAKSFEIRLREQEGRASTV